MGSILHIWRKALLRVLGWRLYELLYPEMFPAENTRLKYYVRYILVGTRGAMIYRVLGQEYRPNADWY
jgi:hypothetical protein